jgi:aminopeptidase N
LYKETWSSLLADRDADPGLLAELLLVPDEPALSEGLPLIDIDGHESARRALLEQLSLENRELLLQRYRELEDSRPYQFNASAVGRRSLRNRCLEFLLASPNEELLTLCLQQLNSGKNMTDRFAALQALCQVDCEQRESGLRDFYEQWQHQPSVIDKWFNAQALIRSPDAIDRVLKLEQHPAMDINNMPRAMAFYGGFFRQNRIGFHAIDGRAYDMLVDRVILIDATKPGTTYWLMPQILQWRRFDRVRKEKMRAALERMLSADISPGLYETVSNALALENDNEVCPTA